MLFAELHQIRQAGHGAVGIEDFADQTRRREAGEAGEIDAGFGVAGAAEDAAVFGSERIDMAGLDELARGGFRIGQELDGAGAIVGADAGGDAVGGIDGHGEVGAGAFTVVVDHALEAEFARRAPCVQGTQMSRARVELVMKLTSSGVTFFGGHDEVAFVFAVGVIRDDDHAAGADFLQDVFDGIKLRRGGHAVHFHCSGPAFKPGEWW